MVLVAFPQCLQQQAMSQQLSPDKIYRVREGNWPSFLRTLFLNTVRAVIEERLRTRAVCGLGQPRAQRGKCWVSARPCTMQWTICCSAPKPSKEKVSCRFSKFELPPMPRGVYELLDQDNDNLTFLDPLGDTVINFTI